MEGDEYMEVTPVEYARLHGLAVNHLLEPFPLGDIEGLQKEIPDALTNDSHLQQIQTSFSIKTEDRLTLSKGAARLLSDANKIVTATQENDFLLTSLLDIQTTRRLRVETPLLRSNHESDCKTFGRYQEPSLNNIGLPLEILDDERNEGLRWPKSEIKIPEILFKEIQAARIDVQKATLLYLQDILKDDWAKEVEHDIWEEELKYKRVCLSFNRLASRLAAANMTEAMAKLTMLPGQGS